MIVASALKSAATVNDHLPTTAIYYDTEYLVTKRLFQR